jgi:Transcriptional regulatory protein, C terminal
VETSSYLTAHTTTNSLFSQHFWNHPCPDRVQILVRQPHVNIKWRSNVFVEPANLTVHMSALRRALRDGQNGNRFIINIPGRGYRFVAPVDVSGHEN